MEQSRITGLSDWLQRRGYQNDHLVSVAVGEMCDTVDELLALKYEDIEANMPMVKVGVRRALMALIDEDRERPDRRNKSQEAGMQPQQIQQQDATPADSHVSQIERASSFCNRHASKVNELLKLCDGRIIYGRNNKDHELTPYEAAMNEQAVIILLANPNLVIKNQGAISTIGRRRDGLGIVYLLL